MTIKDFYDILHSMIGVTYRLLIFVGIISIFWCNAYTHAKQVQEPVKKQMVFMYDPCDKGVVDFDEDMGVFLEPMNLLNSTIEVVRAEILPERIYLPNVFFEIINPPD